MQRMIIAVAIVRKLAALLVEWLAAGGAVQRSSQHTAEVQSVLTAKRRNRTHVSNFWEQPAVSQISSEMLITMSGNLSLSTMRDNATIAGLCRKLI